MINFICYFSNGLSDFSVVLSSLSHQKGSDVTWEQTWKYGWKQLNFGWFVTMSLLVRVLATYPVPCLCPMTAAIVSRQQWNVDKTAKYWRKTFLNFQLTIFISWLNTRKSGIRSCRNLSILSVLIIAASHRANWNLLPMYGIVCTGWIGPAGCSWDEVIRGV